MIIILIIIIIFLSLCPLFLNHPLSLGLNLLVQTILIASITGIISLNFWVSYLLFLVIVGGILILFIYITRIASNEKFFFSKNLLITAIIVISIIITYLIFISKNNFYSTRNLDSIQSLNFSIYEISPNKYFINNSKFILRILIIYLFITLIAIVNISSNNFGPLRQKI